jgi:hypothetical protein
MTITSTISTVADSIAGLTLSGVTIKDIDQIPDAARMLCPLIIPNPANFVTDVSISFETYGSNGGAKINTNYTLNYMFLFCEVSSGLGAFAAYSGLIAKLSAILVLINSNDAITGAVDVKINSIGNIGTITDPAGNDFWGLEFSLKVLEYSQ